jgi:hypothetical protein
MMNDVEWEKHNVVIIFEYSVPILFAFCICRDWCDSWGVFKVIFMTLVIYLAGTLVHFELFVMKFYDC